MSCPRTRHTDVLQADVKLPAKLLRLGGKEEEESSMTTSGIPADRGVRSALVCTVKRLTSWVFLVYFELPQSTVKMEEQCLQ